MKKARLIEKSKDRLRKGPFEQSDLLTRSQRELPEALENLKDPETLQQLGQANQRSDQSPMRRQQESQRMISRVIEGKL